MWITPLILLSCINPSYPSQMTGMTGTTADLKNFFLYIREQIRVVCDIICRKPCRICSQTVCKAHICDIFLSHSVSRLRSKWRIGILFATFFVGLSCFLSVYRDFCRSCAIVVAWTFRWVYVSLNFYSRFLRVLTFFPITSPRSQRWFRGPMLYARHAHWLVGERPIQACQ